MPQRLKLFFIDPVFTLRESRENDMGNILVADVTLSTIRGTGQNLIWFDLFNDKIVNVHSITYKQKHFTFENVEIDIKFSVTVSDCISAIDLINCIKDHQLPRGLLLSNHGVDDLFLFVISFQRIGSNHYYTAITRNERESYYLKFFEESGETIIDNRSLKRLMACYEEVLKYVNPDNWYSRWSFDYEKEIKFTCFTWQDVWSLLIEFYTAIRAGRLQGFIPEINDELQVWDYDNQIYGIESPDDKKGYVSFIEQADGRTTVKHKIFQQDQEIRKESIASNQLLAKENFRAFAEEVSGAVVAPLPAFRRKRFDVNIESINTGNIYGVFMEVCRVLDSPIFMVQVEVEYLRSRALRNFEKVEEEFDCIRKYTGAFLENNASAPFVEGYYSKLTFVKDALIQLSRQ